MSNPVIFITTVPELFAKAFQKAIEAEKTSYAPFQQDAIENVFVEGPYAKEYIDEMLGDIRAGRFTPPAAVEKNPEPIVSRRFRVLSVGMSDAPHRRMVVFGDTKYGRGGYELNEQFSFDMDQKDVPEVGSFVDLTVTAHIPTKTENKVTRESQTGTQEVNAVSDAWTRMSVEEREVALSKAGLYPPYPENAMMPESVTVPMKFACEGCGMNYDHIPENGICTEKFHEDNPVLTQRVRRIVG